MVISLSGDIDNNMLIALIKAIGELKENDKLTIYFTCPEGGFTDVTRAVINLINNNKDRVDIVFYGELFSSGMVLFLYVECKILLLEDTRGMYHFGWQEMSINETGKPSGEYDIFSMKEMKKSKIRIIEFLSKTKMSDKEIASIKQGKDVYFSYERMLELVK